MNEFRKPTKMDSLLKLKEGEVINPRTIFDVGGGETGTPALGKVFPNSKHVIFEPQTEYEEGLKKYAERFGLDHELHFKALSGKTPDTLNSFVIDREYESPYLIKLDVDGEDFNILSGSTDLLLETDCVVVESNIFKFYYPEDHSHSRRDIFNFMNFLNFYNFFLFDITELCYTQDFLTTVDLVFVNKRLWKENKDNLRPDYSKVLGPDRKRHTFHQRIFNENNEASKELLGYLENHFD